MPGCFNLRLACDSQVDKGSAEDPKDLPPPRDLLKKVDQNFGSDNVWFIIEMVTTK